MEIGLARFGTSLRGLLPAASLPPLFISRWNPVGPEDWLGKCGMNSESKISMQWFLRALFLRTTDSPLSLEQRWIRVGVMLAGLLLLGLLFATRWLTPDTRGLGTHEQLGLPPCGFYVWWGIPCPSCGMTTSWAWLVQFEFAEAFRQHSGGALLGLFSLGLGLWCVFSAMRGSWIGGWPSSLAWAVVMAGLALAILISWIGKLWA